MKIISAVWSYSTFFNSVPLTWILIFLWECRLLPRCSWGPRCFGLLRNECWLVDCVWNVMAHAQKPDFVLRRNGRVHLNRRGRHFSRLLAAEVRASAVVMVVMLYTPCSEVVWRVLATHFIRQFPLHFPYRASPCAVTFQLESTFYRRLGTAYRPLNGQSVQEKADLLYCLKMGPKGCPDTSVKNLPTNAALRPQKFEYLRKLVIILFA